MDYAILGKAPNTAEARVMMTLDASGNAVPAAAATPVPTSATAAPSVATDASSTITTGGAPQNVFGATIPTNGWAVYNPDASETLWVSDTTTAAPNAVGSIPVFAGSGYETPPGRKPIAAVSIVAATSGHKFTASRW